MSSANPPPYSEAKAAPGTNRLSPQGSNSRLQTPHQVKSNTMVVSGDTMTYVRPAGQTVYLVHDQGSGYRAYGQQAPDYVVLTGQPASVATTQHPTNTTTATTTVILPTGNCPVCGIGNIYEQFNIFLVLLAIICFPCGLICCLLFTQHRCSHCGNRFR